MNQTKLVSLIEASTNTAIGFAVSFGIWPLVAWLTDMTYTNAQHWAIVGIFTVSSILRGYLIRRFFNAQLHTTAETFAKKILSKKSS